MIQFLIAGNEYRAGKLNAFQQFHASRKIAPLLPTLLPLFIRLARGEKMADDMAMFAEALAPLTEALATMPDADAEYVISTCLSVVSRKVGDNWTSVWSPSANSCMFDDIDMGVMVQLVIRVLRDSLEPFISGLLSNHVAQQQATT